MKSLKAAAVVAGSLVVAGFAAPALAVDAAGIQPADLNGTVGNLAQGVQVQGLEPEKLIGAKQGGLPKTVQQTTAGLGTGQITG